jgi:hypothetical protein
MRLRETVLIPNTPTFLQILAVEAHLAEGQFLLEEHTLNIEISLISRVGTRSAVSKREDRHNNNNNRE